MSDGQTSPLSIEDYATTFTEALTCQINKEDVGCMIQTQKEMYVLSLEIIAFLFRFISFL